MYENKVLIFTNRDRFPVNEYIYLLFEVSNLRNTALAIVSREDVFYINEKNIGITPFFDKFVKNYFSKPFK